MQLKTKGKQNFINFTKRLPSERNNKVYTGCDITLFLDMSLVETNSSETTVACIEWERWSRVGFGVLKSLLRVCVGYISIRVTVIYGRHRIANRFIKRSLILLTGDFLMHLNGNTYFQGKLDLIGGWIFYLRIC